MDQEKEIRRQQVDLLKEKMLEEEILKSEYGSEYKSHQSDVSPSNRIQKRNEKDKALMMMQKSIDKAINDIQSDISEHQKNLNDD